MKRAFLSSKGIIRFQLGATISLAFVLLFILFFLINHQDVNRLRTRYDKTIDKTRLVQTMRSELLASAEAEKSSVMADTDEASRAFAERSVQASQNVENARIAFETLIEKKSREAEILHDFTESWEKLREIDKGILSLAVQNTNLKAFMLSFGPAAVATRRMEEALNKLMDREEVSHPDTARRIRLASKAMMDALNIYTLEAPHIAETTDAGMDAIEVDMKQLDERVRDALGRLDAQLEGPAKLLLDQARESYREFQAINEEIIDLSRRNSNIRSVAESLGRKRHAMALCLDHLNALQGAVQENATIKATR